MNKKSLLKISGLLFITYLVCLIIYLPADQVVPRLSKQWHVKGTGYSGSIWSGHASHLQVNSVTLKNVDWQVSFPALLIGRLALEIDAGNIRDQQNISANGKITLTKTTLKAKDLTLYVPVAMMAEVANTRLPFSPFGRAKWVLSDADIALNGTCNKLAGNGQWINAKVESEFGNADLGNFDADLQCLDSQIVLNVQEPNALGLTANFSHQGGAQFKIAGKMKPSDSLPASMREAVNFLGKPDNDGYYNIDF
jgi:general secretion pathway protein N